MTQILTATFRDGAFVPEGEIHVPVGTRVRLVVQSLDQPASVEEALQELDRLCDQVKLTGAKRLSREELHDRG